MKFLFAMMVLCAVLACSMVAADPKPVAPYVYGPTYGAPYAPVGYGYQPVYSYGYPTYPYYA